MFDALEPVQDVFTTPQNARVLGVYLRWSTRHMPSGTFRGELAVVGECEEVIIPVTLTVVDICAPAVETFRLTNWFSLENMAKYHEVPLWSEAHWEQIAEYGKQMRHMRQTDFWVPPSLAVPKMCADGHWSFDLVAANG